MSMSSPLEPHLPESGDDGIPAADAGTGAPPPAEGFGVAGEEPDAPEQTRSEQTGEEQTGEESPAAGRGDTVFRTPDPTDVGPDH